MTKIFQRGSNMFKPPTSDCWFLPGMVIPYLPITIITIHDRGNAPERTPTVELGWQFVKDKRTACSTCSFEQITSLPQAWISQWQCDWRCIKYLIMVLALKYNPQQSSACDRTPWDIGYASECRLSIRSIHFCRPNVEVFFGAAGRNRLQRAIHARRRTLFGSFLALLALIPSGNFT